MIKLRNITKIFADDFYALRDISLHVSAGALVVLKGASGSGKSTVLSLIAGLGRPSSGEVLVKNERISKLPDDFAALFRRENIGFIFQKFNLIEDLSVVQNIMIPLIPASFDPQEMDQRVAMLLEKFELSEKKDIPVRNLSGGQQQRVVIVRALICEPSIIIADEPTANLDAKLSGDFVQFLEELKSEGKTILVATHDPIFFDLPFVDATIEMQKGEIL